MRRRLVVDVANWDEGVDLAAWRSRHDLWAVIVKVGGNEGGRYRDRCYEEHYRNAVDAGLHVGAYYYTTSTTVAAAKADAEHMVSLISGRSWDMPIYMDVEDEAQYALGRRALTDVIKAFCDVVESAGYRAGIYVNGSTWLDRVYREELCRYADWIAWWRDDWPAEAGDIGMWQQGTMRLSDGKVLYRDATGFTDMSWCVVDYPAEIAGRGKEAAMGLTVAERTAQVAEHFAADDRHGYSQPNRGTGSIEEVSLSDGSKVTVTNSDVDCSEMVRQCVNVALTGSYGSPIAYMWTGNEDDELTDVGFMRMAFSPSRATRGDVLWVSGHTGVALGGGLQADAHGDEYGGIAGPSRGDQTTHEVEVRSLRSSWTYIYRYAGEEPWLTPEPDEKKRRRPMECLITIEGANTVVWYDGCGVNDLTHTANIAVVKKIYKATVGEDMPNVTLTQEEFARLCQGIRGGYPKHLRKLVEKYAPRSPEA